MTLLLASLLALSPAFAQEFGQIPPGFKFEASKPRTPREPRQPRTPRTPPAPRGPSSAGTVDFNGVSLPRFVFTARGGSPAASIAAAIGAARTSVYASLYALTLPGVAQAMAKAKADGRDARLIYDEGHAFGSKGGFSGGGDATAEAASPQLKQLLDAGVQVRVLRGTGPYGIMHNKFALLDGALLETGSFNWTTAAETQNHENAVFRDDPTLVGDYQAYWDWMWAQALPFSQGKGGLPSGAPPSCAGEVRANGRSFAPCAFSPNGGAEQEVADAIDSANGRVHVAMFSFTSDAITQALIRAKGRGAEVLVGLDRGQASHSKVGDTLRAAGIPVKILTGPGGKGMLHDKLGVFDGLVELGSFNYTTNANLNNYENALFTADPADVDGYEAEFQLLWAEGSDS